jgi:hypothetical protein
MRGWSYRRLPLNQKTKLHSNVHTALLSSLSRAIMLGRVMSSMTLCRTFVSFQIAQHRIAYTKVVVNGISIYKVNTPSPMNLAATLIVPCARHLLQLDSHSRDTSPGTSRSSRYLLYRAFNWKSSILRLIPMRDQREGEI